MNILIKGLVSVFILIFVASLTYADKVEIPIHKTSATGEGVQIGHVTAEDTPYGLLLTPSVEELTPGPHGFHIHQNPDCRAIGKGGKMVPGLAAGGHYDPAGTGKHLGPYQEGHLGDLPILWVDSEGNANTPVLAPRVKVSDLMGRSLMIHANGDNYSDIPKKLGGGGARAACGVVP
ncbi:MAG: Superoxide dismutase (Cu-Zn) 1 precursor [Candidatus Scalindua rubra]|uniref:Superoxide dismutase [Cu-Zn] n=1 Tax=Candidatus Scalindua rubra TaxID=1872076 RepID=A0A1E3X7R2_9BACT|nr:MAG: Superoxide dismutase (Cu-Zn) 1 precursor [Candidatus Scalindua rubra]